MKKILRTLLLSFLLITGVMISVKTDVRAASVPTVTGLKQTDPSSETGVNVEWTPVAVGSDDDLTYEIAIRKAGETKKTLEKAYFSDEFLSGLNPGTSYYVSVRACVNGTWGAYSSEVEVVTEPEFPANLKINQTKAGKDSATFQWKAAPGANLYKVEYGPYDKKKTKYVTTNSISVTGLKKDTDNTCYITPIRKNAKGTFSASGYGVSAGEIALVPNKLSFREIFLLQKDGEASVFMDTGNYADSYEYQYYTAYKNKDKLITKEVTSRSYSERTNKEFKYTKATRIYKVRVRACKKAENGKKFYTNWTNWKYFCNDIKAPTLKNKKGKGIEVKWKKMEGADRYKVYISTSLKAKDFKLAATTKNGKTLKTTITKYNKKALKSKKGYWVYVVPQKKEKGKWKDVAIGGIRGSGYIAYRK